MSESSALRKKGGKEDSNLPQHRRFQNGNWRADCDSVSFLGFYWPPAVLKKGETVHGGLDRA